MDEWVVEESEREGYASFKLYYRRDSEGYRIVKMDWIGKQELPIEIDSRLIDRVENQPAMFPQNLYRFPFPLKLVSRNYLNKSGIYVRTDVGFPLRSRFWQFKYWVRDTGQMLKTRIISTFWVWGLADHDIGRIPAWTDIRFIKNLKNWRHSNGS